MRYDCEVYNNKEMECDGSDLGVLHGLYDGSEKKSGLGLDAGFVNKMPRVDKMDDEEKSTVSKRRVTEIEVRFDSDDDEPIGSMFKVKSKRNPKKVKVGFNGGKINDKQVELREERLLVKDEDFGGMNDTLASFKKKLKGPKKDTGSGLIAGRDSDINVAEPSGQSLNGPLKSEDLASASMSKEAEKDLIAGDDGSDGAADKKFANTAKVKSKRSRSAALQKKTRHNTEFDDARNGQRSGDQSLPNEKECATGSVGGSNDCLGENLEDSLSAFIRKAQSGSIRKSRSSSRSKQINCDGLLEDPLPDVMISQPPSNYVTAVTGFDNSFHLVSGRGSTDLTCDHKNNGKIQNTDYTFSQVSNCIGPNELSSDPCLGISSGPLITNDILRSGGNIHGRSSRGTFDDSFAISSVQQSQSYLMQCSNNISMLQDGEVNELSCGIKEGIKLESHDSDHFLDGNRKEFLCAKVNYCFPSQEPTLGINSSVDDVNNSSIRKACDLGDDVVEMHNSISALEHMQTINLSDADMPTVGFSHSLDQQSKCVARSQTSSTDQKFCSTFDKDVEGPCLANDLSNSVCKDISHETVKQVSGELLEPIASLSQNSLTCNEKMTVTSKPMDGIGSFQCLKGSQQAQPQASTSAFDSSRQVVICNDCISPNRVTGISVEEPDFASVSSQKEEASASDSRLSTVSPSGDHKQENSFQVNQLENSLETGDDPGSLPQQVPLYKSSTSFPRCSSSFHQNQASDDVCKGVHIPIHDFSGDEVANGSSSPSSTPDCNGNYADDIGLMPYPESKDNKLSAGQRAMRITRKRRQMDMAYEGDADWNILIHEQNFLVSNQAEDDNQLKRREKLDSHLTMFSEAENGGAAAVSAGLKARAVGPVEKIKFKEVLKRKGGLQEYLECRNHILGLWNKDVSRILPLSDCGVSDEHKVDESPCASVVRDIYAFLDHSGYINIGVASGKEITESGSKKNLQLLKEKFFGEKSGSQLTDSDDGVSFILGRDKNFDKSMEEKNVAIRDDENRAARDKRDKTLLGPQALKLSTPVEREPEECDDFRGNGRIEARMSNRIANVDLSSSISLSEVAHGGTAHVVPSEHTNNSCGMLSGAVDHNVVHQHMQSDSEVRKRIIVIGAGPAGLAAARHLQRHGFHVTVLEARGRIGGRVFTDRTSLSVPVDLGASIITGVEADVATERRPDPSSLVCAQLGLELTVLNSDCPLYDTVTGHKVPADLDEALEAEYNSLLDDMVLLVAQKGEHAMRMSLEDGLEYALQRRRMVRSSKNYVESDLHKSAAIVDDQVLGNNNSRAEILSPLERRVMDWHFAHLEYGCAALLKEVSLPYWNQDDVYGGFGGAHCMIKGGYSTVVESLGEGLRIHLNHVVTNVTYHTNDIVTNNDQHKKVKVSTLNGKDFFGDAVLVTVPLGCLKKESIKFSPSLPQWKHLSIQRLGFGVLNKVVLEFSEVFWDDSVDYFGATAEETNKRGHCFMFWNVRKTVGAPVLIALVVGKAAIYGQNLSSADHVNHALVVLRKLFGAAKVPDPVASVVTDWGRDPYSYGAYSYVAIGASGEDYDILGRPVENCLFFAGEATCKEHPDTVGGAMMSGLREAVRIMNIFSTGSDCTAEVNAMEAAQRHTDSERSEVRDIMKRLDAVELSNALYKKSLDGAHIMTREALLKDMFFKAKTTAARFHLVKELLSLPVGVLKSFAGTKKGLSTLNSWILDSMGKDGTQLLRHCVRLLVLVSTDLLAVRLSGIGKTVKEKVCVHTSRDIRAVASQLVNVWIEVFRKEKASNGGLKLLRPSSTLDSSKSKYNLASGKPPLCTHHGAPDNRGTGIHLPPNSNSKKGNIKLVKLETRTDAKSEVKPSRSQGSVGRQDSKVEEDKDYAVSKEEQAALAAEEEARAAAIAAAKAYASSDPRCNTSLQLPKIPSFHKFARREQYPQMDESDIRRWSGGVLGRQDCISEIDSRNWKVRDWAVDFSAAACVNLDSSKMSVDNLSQRSHSNEIASQLNFREHSGESVAVDSSIFTKAWVDSAGSEGIKDYSAIDRWQSQAAAADSDFFNRTMHIMDEEDSNINLKPPMRKHDGLANESSASQVTINKELVENQPRGAEKIKQAVVDYVASLLMPLYKARKIDKDGYKSIMKKTATKVMEQTTDVEKLMAVFEFLDFKRKNKIRAFVDKLIERHMAIKQGAKS